MKVVKERKAAPWSAQFTCKGSQTPADPPGCGSVLEVTPSDLKALVAYDASGRNGRNIVQFTCPVCESGTDLGINEIPSWVYKSLEHLPTRGIPCGSGKD